MNRSKVRDVLAAGFLSHGMRYCGVAMLMMVAIAVVPVSAATWSVTEIYSQDDEHILMFTSTNNATATGSWSVPSGVAPEVQILAIGGGGGGGYAGGGGGAGGLVFDTYTIPSGVSVLDVQVGGGGAGGTGTASSETGGHSLFGTLQADGGGAGGHRLNPGGSGGSGGGAGGTRETSGTNVGGSSTSQGYDGGSAYYDADFEETRQALGAGGGGAGAVGQSTYPNTTGSSSDRVGDGGIGIAFADPLFGDFFKTITQSDMTNLLSYAAFLGFAGGGGGGGGQSHEWQAYAVTGYGGGDARRGNNMAGFPAVPHTGGGGGAGSWNGNGGAGGSGIVFLSYTVPPPKGTVISIR